MSEPKKPETELQLGGIQRNAESIPAGKSENLCECLRRIIVNNQFCKEPNAGKPHVRFYEGYIL